MSAALAEALAADREYQRLARSSERWAARRASLPPGSSRARVTTANAKWAQAAEARDIREAQIRAALEGAS